MEEMGKVWVLKILPLSLFVLQCISIIHLYYTYKTEHSHVPVTFIELNIIVFVNIVILIVIYIFIHKIKVESLWILPLCTALLLSLVLLYNYLRMLF